jgi:hypothetical protein
VKTSLAMAILRWSKHLVPRDAILLLIQGVDVSPTLEPFQELTPRHSAPSYLPTQPFFTEH